MTRTLSSGARTYFSLKTWGKAHGKSCVRMCTCSQVCHFMRTQITSRAANRVVSSFTAWQGAQHTLSQAWQWSPSFPVRGTSPVLCHSHSYNLPSRSRWLYYTLYGISPAGASIVQTAAGMLMESMADLPQFTRLPSFGRMLFMLAAVWLVPTNYRPFKAKAWAALHLTTHAGALTCTQCQRHHCSCGG